MESLEQLLKVHSQPQLKEPYLIAAGPGTANVGLRIVNYLREKLEAKLFAEIEPGSFFTPPFIFSFKDGLIETSPIEFLEYKPQNRFYYFISGKSHDLVFFTGNTQPLPGKISELSRYILEAARGFGIKRIFIPSAFMTEIHHLTQPTLYSSVTDKRLQEQFGKYNIEKAPPMNIAHNLNAWLMGMAKYTNIEGVGLVSGIPGYNVEGKNIQACQVVIKVLLQILDIDIPDMSDLDAMLIEEKAKIERWIEELRQSDDTNAIKFIEYIDSQIERDKEIPTNRGFIRSPELKLPESLEPVEELYLQATNDPAKVQELRQAIQQLADSDRLMVLRKYGDSIMSLLGYQV